MNDLPKRLRRLYVQDGTNYVQEAADEIERLRERQSSADMCLDAVHEARRVLREHFGGNFAFLDDDLEILGAHPLMQFAPGAHLARQAAKDAEAR